MSDLLKLGIWAAIVGAVFGFLWWKGYLARFAQYVAETREELRKCNWPTKEELKGATVVIMITILLLGLYLALVDLVITQVVWRVLLKL